MSTANFSSAPVLQTYDPAWALAAARYLSQIQAAMSVCGAADGATLEHIGSTAVPGLSAKPIIDLQIQVTELRHGARFDAALISVGFLPAQGSRPDSPGVYRDLPRGSEQVPDEMWDKRLFIRPDPRQPAVLHIRKSHSPWARYTIQFRDWLREHPTQRMRYQQIKTELAYAHAGDPDVDDYTRAKTAYFDAVQGSFERYGREVPAPRADRVPATTHEVVVGENEVIKRYRTWDRSEPEREC